MLAPALTDITTASDIDRLVAAFYTKLLVDPIIGFLFTDIAFINLGEHLPVISAFWQQQLLGSPTYRGHTLAVHRQLNARCTLRREHFERWLYLFSQTVNELFCGPHATAAKQRARRIAESMQGALVQPEPFDTDFNVAAGVQYFQPESAPPRLE